MGRLTRQPKHDCVSVQAEKNKEKCIFEKIERQTKTNLNSTSPVST